MPNKTKTPSVEELVRDLMIIQLGLAGIPQKQIREIVGGGIDHVNGIVRHLKKKKV
jgi:hypothetical protein